MPGETLSASIHQIELEKRFWCLQDEIDESLRTRKVQIELTSIEYQFICQG